MQLLLVALIVSTLWQLLLSSVLFKKRLSLVAHQSSLPSLTFTVIACFLIGFPVQSGQTFRAF